MKKLSNLVAAAGVAAAIFFGTNVKAQTGPANAWRLGIGVEGGIPTGTASDGSNFELGGTARLQYGLTDKFSLTLTSGYYDFFAKTVTGTVDGVAYSVKGPNAGIVPVKVGIKDFFTQNLYYGAEIGAGFETNNDSQTKLILSPAVGYATKSWDVGVRYENFSGSGDNFGVVALRVAYGFSL